MQVVVDDFVKSFGVVLELFVAGLLVKFQELFGLPLLLFNLFQHLSTFVLHILAHLLHLALLLLRLLPALVQLFGLFFVNN